MSLVKLKLFDIINNIFFDKKHVDDEQLTEYNAFMVNRAHSYYLDTVLYGNTMNTHYSIPDTLQYKVLLSNVSKRKRFSKWYKKEKSNLVEKIMKYYGYSYKRSLEVLHLFTSEAVEWLNEKLDTGGIKNAKKTND